MDIKNQSSDIPSGGRNSKIKISAIIAAVLVAAGILIFFAAGKSLISEIGREVKIGEKKPGLAAAESPAPDFLLISSDGEEISLFDMAGRPFILIFWTTWDTQASRVPGIIDDYKAGVGEDAPLIIPVASQEDPSAVKSFLARGGYRIKPFVDVTGEMTEKYSAHILPAAYFVDREGVIRKISAGVVDVGVLEEGSELILR